MIWKAENVGGGIIKKAETGETDKNATDQDRPITTDLRYLSLTANNITAKLTNQVIDPDLTHSTDNKYSLHSDDDFRSGGRNVSHHYRQHFSSGLHSPGRSNYTISCYPRVQTIYCNTLLTTAR